MASVTLSFALVHVWLLTKFLLFFVSDICGPRLPALLWAGAPGSQSKLSLALTDFYSANLKAFFCFALLDTNYRCLKLYEK